MPEADVKDLPAGLWRVHKPQYGALNPPPRNGTPDQSWSRFDIPGWAVVYGASTRLGAYLESLAYAKPAPIPVEELFDDDPEAVGTQWAGLGHMLPGHVARQWRDVRELSCFSRRADLGGSVVDLASAQTISYLRDTVRQWAPPRSRRSHYKLTCP